MASISGTDPSAQAAADPSSALASATQGGLDKNAFMKLLVAQIAHQDPTKPMDDTAFVAQLAQFSSLEQAMSTNSKLDTLAAQQRGVANTDTAALVGKTVTVNGNTVSIATQGAGGALKFTLGGAATDVTVNIKDQTGTVVRSIKLGAEAAGKVNVSWDGKNDSGVAQPVGTYTVSVDAKGQGGGAVQVTQQTTGVLQSVSFAAGYTQLILADGTTAPASDLVSVDAPAAK